MKVIFFGTPQFAANVLAYLFDQGVDVVAVVTRTDKPKGRTADPVYTPVKNLVLEKKPTIALLQPEKISTRESAELLSQFEADLFVVVAYGEILQQFILDIPKVGCINLHTSLLPKYRGAAPIQRCIMAGEIETGVTIMHMVKKMDAGDIIKTVKVAIGPNDSFGGIEQKLCFEGSKLLFEVIQNASSYILTHIQQDEACLSYAPKLELEDCEINWNESAEKIHNLVRGVNPHPGAWCYVYTKGSKKRLKIKTTFLDHAKNVPVGTILSCTSDGMIVGCGAGALKITELQLEGKRVMTPEELYRGTSFKFIHNPVPSE